MILLVIVMACGVEARTIHRSFLLESLERCDKDDFIDKDYLREKLIAAEFALVDYCLNVADGDCLLALSGDCEKTINSSHLVSVTKLEDEALWWHLQGVLFRSMEHVGDKMDGGG